MPVRSIAQSLTRDLESWRTALSQSPHFVFGVLLGIFVCAILAFIGPRWLRLLAALALFPLAAAWVLANHYLEGPTLLALSHNHGITASDLLSVGAVILATTALARISWQHSG